MTELIEANHFASNPKYTNVTIVCVSKIMEILYVVSMFFFTYTVLYKHIPSSSNFLLKAATHGASKDAAVHYGRALHEYLDVRASIADSLHLARRDVKLLYHTQTYIATN